MKSTHAISMISGDKVPYNISYFPSVIPKDDVVLKEYIPVSSSSLETLRLYSPSNQFERGTQTSFRYTPNKYNPNIVVENPNNFNEVPTLKLRGKLSHRQFGDSQPIESDVRDNIYQIIQNTPTRSNMGAPLTRSASYEKAILSSMKELDYNIKFESKSLNSKDASPTFHKGCSPKTPKASPSIGRSSSCSSSNKSLSCGFSNVSEVFQSRKGSFEKWKKRTSLTKCSTLSGDDKEMKLLKHEQLDASAFSDEKQQQQQKQNNNNHLKKCDERNILNNDHQNESFNTLGESVEVEERDKQHSSTLPLRMESLMRTTRGGSPLTTADSKAVVVLDVIGKQAARNKEITPVAYYVKEQKSSSPKVELQMQGDKDAHQTKDYYRHRNATTHLQKSVAYCPEGGGSEYPYLREMKERLLIAKDAPLGAADQPPAAHQTMDPQNQLLEVHQTPVGTVVKLNADGYGSHTSPTHRVESFYTGTLESRKTTAHEFFPKNAKTSSFITLSLLYATLLVVVCLGFVLSEVLTHNVPLYYYEAFFTYLYGLSIFFLLYVFCYLLNESTAEDNAAKNQKVRKPEVLPTDGSPTQEKLTAPAPRPKKQKTTDNDHSHGSFFLRIGAIAFGLGTMIYNGLEFGVFFEIPTTSPCFQVLRGVNPLLQLVFTFMQMYFIFMNARLNIHKFKFVARFGLMHIVATNICVWVRTLVRESLKEINEFRVTQGHTGEDYMIMEGIRRALENRGLLAPNRYMYNLGAYPEFQETVTGANETVALTDTPELSPNQPLPADTEEDLVNRTCERMEIMGSIVSDSAPYLYPFIVEYSLIGAAVVYIMWKHIGRHPKFMYDPEAGDGMSVVSRRCHSKVDCVGASKGLFCGLLVLVATLICLILFFVLIHRKQLRMLAIYLADVSHCGIMVLSIIAIFIGFCRVRHLKFFGEREEELDDILLMVSAFGLFAYATFSAVAGSLSAFTEEPNLLVMITGILSIAQVMIQMVFIKDTQRRQVALPEQERTKPGRQIVTFVLICNLAMWVIYTFETQKVEANPVQLEFFGKLSWTILLRCTLPLAIFHRFHSSVVLAAIWKNSYKTRLE